MKTANEWFREIKQSEKSPIRLSDIDNLLQESIFESSDGAKLVEYLKKKRGGGGGRVRLQNIFQQVPVQRAQFNFNLDTTDPTPLPDSPQPTSSNAAVVEQHYVIDQQQLQQLQQPVEMMANGESVPVVVTTMADGNPPVPIVIVNDLNQGNVKMQQHQVKQIVLKSPGPMNALSRQVLINQYQRTNAAKCELLKQLATSTPRPDSNGSLGRMSTFTSSISPITEGDRTPLTAVVEVIPSAEHPPVPVMEIVVPPPVSQEVYVPCSQPILAPCSQAVGGMEVVTTPNKVVVLQTVVEPQHNEEVVIPETPSPARVVTESPKAPPHQAPQPRRLSTTFKQVEEQEEEAANGHMTSDESEVEEQEEEEPEGGSNSVLLKSILKDTSMGGGGGRSRHSFRVSFSRQLVQQREISPAPSIPEANDYNDSNSTDESEGSDSDMEGNEEYQVVDEVYTDDDGEEGDSNEVYEELKSRICELNNTHNGRRSVSPLIDVVKETPVQWFETTTPTKRSDQQEADEQQFPPPTTAKKDNKTNLQLVDIITDWDDEEDEEEGEHSASNPEIEPVSEQRASTNSNHHDTNLDTMDISSSNLEDSVERLVELPPAPNGLIEEEGVLPEEHIYPAAVDESMPIVLQITTEELVEVLSEEVEEIPQTQPEDVEEIPETQHEDVEEIPETQHDDVEAIPETQPEDIQEIPETQPDEPVEIPETQPEPVQEEQPVELPPPPTPSENQEEAPPTPERVITPPVQFTTSAKRRFIQQNEEELISRLQNDLPLSQASSDTDNNTTIEEPLKPSEKVSETLMEIAQSFRDQPPILPSSSQPPPADPPTAETTRKVVQPPKRGRKKSTATDPVTASYFEAIKKTFAKPQAPEAKKTDQQKRKLYDATLSEVTENEEESPVRVAPPKAAEPVVEVAPTPPPPEKELPKMREFKVVVQKLKFEDYLPKKKKAQPEVQIVQEVPRTEEEVPLEDMPLKARRRASRDQAVSEEATKVRARRASRDKPPQQKPQQLLLPVPVTPDSATKRPRGRPKKVRTESTTEREVAVESVPQQQEPVENGSPDLVGDSQVDEGLPNGVSAFEAARQDEVEEKKKKKPNLTAEDEALSNGVPVEGRTEELPEEDLPLAARKAGEKKKKKLRHNSIGESQKQQSVDKVIDVEAEDSRKDKPKEKKKSQQPSERKEDLPTEAVACAAVVEPNSDKAQTEEKKQLTPNLDANTQQKPDEVSPSTNGISDKAEEARKKQFNLAGDSQKPQSEEVIDVDEEDSQEGKTKEKEKSQQQLPEVVEPDSGKVNPKLKPKLVAATENQPANGISAEESKKKNKLKPNLPAAAQKEQQSDAVQPTELVASAVVVEPDLGKDKIMEKKKLKPKLAGVSQRGQSTDEVIDVDEEDSRKEKARERKKLKPNLAAAAQKEQQPDDLPIEIVDSGDVAEPDSGKDKPKEKKKMRPNLEAVSQKEQQMDEIPPAETVTSVEVVEPNAGRDKPKEKKKLKPNLDAISQKGQQPDENLPTETAASVDVAEIDSNKDKPTEKKKLKPNLAVVIEKQQKSVESLPNEVPVVAVQKKKLKPNLAAVTEQQQQPDESSPSANGIAAKDKPEETKKKKLKPNLAAISQKEQRPIGIVSTEPAAVVEQDSGKDKPKEKKQLKPNLAASSQKEQQPDENVPTETAASLEVVEPNSDKDKRKKLRSNLAAGPQKDQQQDENVPTETAASLEIVEPDTGKDKMKDKNKKLKPVAANQKEQSLDEAQPAEIVASVEVVEPDSGKGKIKEKKKLATAAESVSSEAPAAEVQKKKLKPNLDAVSQQQQQPVHSQPVTDDHPYSQKEPASAEPSTVPAEPQSTKQVDQAEKKKKLKPNFGTKSKQQLAEVAPDRLTEEQQAASEPPMTCQEVVAKVPPAKKRPQRKSIDGRLEKQQPKTVAVAAEVKVKLTKLAVDPTTVSMSPASKAILQAKVASGGCVEPSPVARKLFDDDEVQPKVAAKKTRKASTDAASAEEQAQNKRKEVKRAKLKDQDDSVDPIPQVRISAEKNGVFRITTPAEKASAAIDDSLAEPLNATELDNSGTSIRTSLEDNPEDFFGFEDAHENTVADVSVDLSSSNMELVIPLEKAPIPEGVAIVDDSNKIKKQRRQSRSLMRKRSRSVRNSIDAEAAVVVVVEPPQAASPERRATSPSKIDNDSLPLKKRKSRDSSREYLPEEEQPPQPQPVEPEQPPLDLNDSMLIPVLQRVPIADKYLVRSSPDRDTESAEEEYDSDDSSSSNVLIVRKDHSRFEQSLMLDPEEEAEEEERVKNLQKKSKPRKSMPLPRFYGDNSFDITWVPKQRKRNNAAAAGGSRKTKRRHDNDSGIEEEEAIRRSKRTCRISKAILMTNPLIKSAYDRPNYRPMTVEQLLEAEEIAKKQKQEENARYRKKPVAEAATAGTKNRKRIQEASEEDQQQQQQAKKSRVEEAVEAVDVQPSTSAGPSSSTASGSGTSSSSSSSAPTSATVGVEVAVQVDEDREDAVAVLQQERLQAHSWMMKLMADNNGREEVMPQATSSGDRMHFQLDHLTFQERNGIQYSFFIYSETENFGFLRFAPAAVKKWTKTADFLLKFLVLHGQLSFQINGKETVTKGGDFLMLPQNTRYRIQNSDEISLVFMIKFRAATGNELPSM